MFSFFLKNSNIILDFVSIFAFVLSTGQLIYNFWKNKCRLKISIYNYEYAENRNYFFLSTCICNMSSSPISITQIFLLGNNNNTYPCTLHHVWMGEYHFHKSVNTDIPCTERILSADFPINLVPHEASLCHIAFRVDDATSLFHQHFYMRLKIQTNKKSKYFRVYCPAESSSFLSL